MRHLIRTLASSAILAAAAACHPKAAHAAVPLLGLYEGASCAIAAQNAPARNMLGRTEDLDTLFIDYTQTPEYAYTNVDWSLGCYRSQVPNVALAVPLAVTKPAAGRYGITAGAYTLADVDAGKLDAFYAHVAHSAISHGFPHAHMRLGWEMNGGWYLWAAHGQEMLFNSAFCHVKAVMQAAEPTAHFTYWLNPTVNADASNEHPDACMDASTGVAWDQYENYYTTDAKPIGAPAYADAFARWWGIGSEGSWYGSASHAAPEVGFGWSSSPTATSSLDDPVYTASVIAYDVSQHVAYFGLWDSNASYAGGRISDGSKPGEALEIIKVWGAAPLPKMLAGASLYTGSDYRAPPPPGYHAVLAQLANGDVEQLAWGDQVGQTIQALDLTAAAKTAAAPRVTAIGISPSARLQP